MEIRTQLGDNCDVDAQSSAIPAAHAVLTWNVWHSRIMRLPAPGEAATTDQPKTPRQGGLPPFRDLFPGDRHTRPPSSDVSQWTGRRLLPYRRETTQLSRRSPGHRQPGSRRKAIRATARAVITRRCSAESSISCGFFTSASTDLALAPGYSMEF